MQGYTLEAILMEDLQDTEMYLDHVGDVESSVGCQLEKTETYNFHCSMPPHVVSSAKLISGPSGPTKRIIDESWHTNSQTGIRMRSHISRILSMKHPLACQTIMKPAETYPHVAMKNSAGLHSFSLTQTIVVSTQTLPAASSALPPPFVATGCHPRL